MFGSIFYVLLIISSFMTQLTKWKMNFTHMSKNCTSMFNTPCDAKHHSTYRVSAIGMLSIAAEAFLWDKAPLSGKDVVKCVERLF